MENIQINGQRRWGPPKDWTGPPPPHGTEIFIKNLADDVYEEEIFRIFSGAGSIFEVRLPVHWNGANRGYAFVRYTLPEEAEAGIALFDRHQLRPGKPIRVERSVDNTRLFLSAVQKDKTAEDIKNDLSELVEKVEKVYVYPTLEDRTLFRGYAFVEFETHRDAAIAKRILTPDVCASVFEKKCIAAWANPLPFLDGNVRQTINVLFMRNIPKEMKNFDLKKEIKDLLGSEEIFKIKRLKNFAFLTFKDHHQTEAALNRLKSEFSFTNRYEIEVDWAVPRELAQSVSSHLRKSSALALRETEFKPSCEKTGKFEPKQSQEANGMQYGNLISTFLPRSDAINFQNAGKIPTETDWPLFFRSSPGPQLVSVPEPNVPKFKIGGPTFARPIRGSKFSPPVSYCDSDGGDSLSPPTTFPWDFRDLGFFLEGPVREVNPFYFGAREPFAIP